MQLEEGAFPTSYIPTSGAAVTRAADALSLPTAGWLGYQQGTLITDVVMPYGNRNSSGWTDILTLLKNGSNYIGVAQNGSGRTKFNFNFGGTSVYQQFSDDLYVASSVSKICAAYSPETQGGSNNGLAFPAGGALSIPDFHDLNLGRGSAPFTGWFRRLIYFPTRQPDESLADYTRRAKDN